MKMRGYGVITIKNPGWIEKDKPVAGPLDAVIRPIAVAPCSSDVELLHGYAGDKKNIILGHEALGVVIEVGKLVKKFKTGDRVIVPCVTPDWESKLLQERGANNAHDAVLMGGFKFLNQKDGVFAEFFHVNNADANLVHLPEDVSIEDALMTVDMMSTGFHAAENAHIAFGDTVAVFGIGPVGLMAVAGSVLQGAGRVFAVGTRPECVKLAKEYGATDIVSYKEGPTDEQILDLNHGQVDRVIIANTNIESFNQALKLVRPNGTISNIAFLDSRDTISFPTLQWGLGMANVEITSGFCPGGAYRIEHMLNLIRANRCHPGKLINYKFNGFDQIEDAFKVMDEKPRDLIKPICYIED